MLGGKRKGAGRKKGSKAPHTIEAEKAREFIIQKVCEALEPIIDRLIEDAKKGDKESVKILFDRGFGKPKESMEISGNPENPFIIKWEK